MPASAARIISCGGRNDVSSCAVLMENGDLWGWGINGGKFGKLTGPKANTDLEALPKKVKVLVPAKKKAAYKKWLYKKGINKKATVK